jgi:hypothetical protein
MNKVEWMFKLETAVMNRFCFVNSTLLYAPFMHSQLGRERDDRPSQVLGAGGRMTLLVSGPTIAE